MDNNGISIFRKAALDKITSPEQLTDYIRVTTPGVWVVLVTVISLLVGIIAWASIGHLETTVNVKATVEDNQAQIIIPEGTRPQPDMVVRLSSHEYPISEVVNGYNGEKIAIAPVKAANGGYNAVLVVESITPISFLFQ